MHWEQFDRKWFKTMAWLTPVAFIVFTAVFAFFFWVDGLRPGRTLTDAIDFAVAFTVLGLIGGVVGNLIVPDEEDRKE